jgi:hypothetical protein
MSQINGGAVGWKAKAATGSRALQALLLQRILTSLLQFVLITLKEF